MDFYEVVEHIESKYDLDLYNYKGFNFIGWAVENELDILHVYSSTAPPLAREVLFLIAKEFAPRKGKLPIEL